MPEDPPAQTPPLVRNPTAFAKGVGIEYLELGNARSSLKIPYQEKLIGDAETGAVHAGLIISLLDHSSGGAVMSRRGGRGFSSGTLDLRVDFMRPSEPGREIFAAAHCFALNETGGFVHSFCYHDDIENPFAASMGIFLSATGPREEGGNLRKVREAPATEPPTLNLGATEIAQRLATIPYANYLQMRHGTDEAGEGVFQMDYAPYQIGNPVLPALHGGVLGTFLETAATHELWAQLGRRPTLLNVEIDFLRSGRPVTTYAKAHVRKSGRRVVIVEAVAWQTDEARPITTLYAHYLI